MKPDGGLDKGLTKYDKGLTLFTPVKIFHNFLFVHYNRISEMPLYWILYRLVFYTAESHWQWI